MNVWLQYEGLWSKRHVMNTGNSVLTPSDQKTASKNKKMKVLQLQNPHLPLLTGAEVKAPGQASQSPDFCSFPSPCSALYLLLLNPSLHSSFSAQSLPLRSLNCPPPGHPSSLWDTTYLWPLSWWGFHLSEPTNLRMTRRV